MVVMAGAIPNFTSLKDIMSMMPDEMQPRIDLMPGANMTTPELIAFNNYPVEIHYVTTEDGYILELHRIPHGVAGPNVGEPKVAFLHHCLLCSSADWVMNTPDEALAYLMADAGYDVWMTNARGNTYSRNHTTLSPEENKFWQFTWSEMGLYDAPATIDYVLQQTGVDQVYYVGFSMGSTVYFTMLAQLPHYAEKIKTAALMGPAAYMENMKGLFRALVPYAHKIDLACQLVGCNEFLPSGPLWDEAMEVFCEPEVATAGLCEEVLFLISGPDPAEFNVDYMPVILSHTPAGSSTKTLVHYAQLCQSKLFRMYDWGRLGNLANYGQNTPPLYNLSYVTPPTALFWSDNDYLADPLDVAKLVDELPNMVLNHHVEMPEFSHLDFVWAMHAKELVYDYLLDYLSHY